MARRKNEQVCVGFKTSRCKLSIAEQAKQLPVVSARIPRLASADQVRVRTRPATKSAPRSKKSRYPASAAAGVSDVSDCKSGRRAK